MDSGRITGNLRRPQRYNRRLRHVFYMAAFSSVKADGPSRAFYQRKRSEWLAHTQALLALAGRLVDVLWALLRDDRLFSRSASATSGPGGLTTSFRFVLARLRALHLGADLPRHDLGTHRKYGPNSTRLSPTCVRCSFPLGLTEEGSAFGEFPNSVRMQLR
jgi:hypothetical protein